MQSAGIDRVRDFGQRLEQFALESNRLGHRAGAATLKFTQRHRMTPARF